MSKSDDLGANNLDWLVNNRSRHQSSALKLFLLIKDNKQDIRSSRELANVCQGLVAVCFSLWRAVFLSDIKGDMSSTVDDAHSFLGGLILHNAINYSQDRIGREWTYRYYINNARYRLEKISEDHEDLIPSGFISPLSNASMKDWWTYLQTAFDIGVKNFELKLRLNDENSN